MSTNRDVREDGGIRVSEGGQDARPQIAAIEAEISQTRSQMSGTIGALEDRLSPARMKEQLLEQLRDAKDRVKTEVQEDITEVKRSIHREIDEAKSAVRDATIGRVEHAVHEARETLNETGNIVMSTIRDNPIPSLLAGIGLTWLFVNARSSARKRPRYVAGYDTYGDLENPWGYRGNGGQRPMGAMKRSMRGVEDGAMNVARRARDAAGNFVDEAGNVIHETEEKIEAVAHRATEKARDLASNAKDTATHFAHDVRERATDLTHQARDEAMRIEHRVERSMQENPLAIGMAVFAAGTAVGLVLPRTAREDELLGRARDNLMDKAEQMAEKAVDTAREKVGGVIASVGDGSAGEESRAPREIHH